MAGLPQKLYSKCFSTLKLCSEFDEDEDLRSNFITPELLPLKDSLPQASTKHKRVGKTIGFLLEQSLSKNAPLLPHFIDILVDRYHGDHLQLELSNLHIEITKFFEEDFHITSSTNSSSVELPFIILSMTGAEARALFDETAFDDRLVSGMDKDQFLLFKDALIQSGLIPDRDLICCYDDSRDNWKPANSEKKMSNAVNEVIGSICIERVRSGEPPICPKFLSDRFFNEEEPERVDIWDEVGETGCILIIDAISLFHPRLRFMLSNSGLGSKNNIAIIIISPLNSYANSVNGCIEDIIKTRMELVFSRFSKKFDKLCEIGIGNTIALQRWLYAAIPDEARVVTKLEPNWKSKEVLRHAMNMKPGGIGYAIAGQGMQ